MVTPRQTEMDADMRELVGLLRVCVRKPNRHVWRENPHAPYYSRSRYRGVA